MIHFVLGLMGACAHFLWNALGAVLDFSFGLLSALATLVAWPFKAVHGLLRGAVSWTPVFLGFCLILGALVLAFTVFTLWRRSRR